MCTALRVRVMCGVYFKQKNDMTTVLLYGFLSGFSLVVGALMGVLFRFSRTTIAAIMAFGSGVLVCALSFGLMEEAFQHGGFDAVIIGFLLGGLLFIGGNWVIHRVGGRTHRRHAKKRSSRDTDGLAIVLGAALDGIPESIAMGIALALSPSVGLMMVAVMLSNFPEAVASITGLRKEGFRPATIIGIWTIVGAIVATTVVMSFLFLGGLDSNHVGILEAFAAGAILAMLADNMMPEAYEDGGFMVGFLTVVGFLVTFVVSHVS